MRFKRNRKYPKWKHLIPKNISHDVYREAFKICFDFYPEECEFDRQPDDELNSNVTIKTPKGIIFHGGFIEHTDEPELGRDNEIDYINGCTWSTDKNGKRYYLIGSRGLPYKWEEVKALEIVKKYRKEYIKYQRLEKLKKIERNENRN